MARRSTLFKLAFFLTSLAILAGSGVTSAASLPGFLSDATPEQACQYKVLSGMGIQFEQGSPPNNPRSPGGSAHPCSDDVPPVVAKISGAGDLANWIESLPTYCQYKKDLSVALKRAADKLAQNKNYTFLTHKDLLDNRLCVLESPKLIDAWKQTGNAHCYASVVSSDLAMKCFYTEECRLECGAGAVNLQNLGAYELFKGPGEDMSDAQANLYNHYYPENIVGPTTGRIQQTSNPFAGYDAKNPTSIARYSNLGSYGLTGLRLTLTAKDSDHTADAYFKNQSDPWQAQKASEISSNSIVIRTSPEAVKDFVASSKPDPNCSPDEPDCAVVKQIERDMNSLKTLVYKLSHRDPKNILESEVNADNSLKPEARYSYEQIMSGANLDAVLSGEYQLIQRPGVSDGEFQKDQEIYHQVRELLNKPMYRDTQIYIHPSGTTSLAAAFLDKAKYQPGSQLTVIPAPNGEAPNRLKYVQSRIDACLGRRFDETKPAR